MKSIIIYILTIISTIQTGKAQTEKFEPGVISKNDVFGIAISPDSKHLLYVAAYGGRDSLRIFESYKKNKKWQTPSPAFFNDNAYPHIDPAYSPDGKTILYNVSKDSTRGFDIYVINKTAGGWSKPILLNDSVNSKFSDFYATMSLNRNIYFTRRTESNDIYVSRFVNGEYRKAVPVSPTINTVGAESNPYISPGEEYLIFFSDRPGGFGDSDLYISFQKNGAWSIPQNLGPQINTAIAEFCPGIFDNGKYFYFSRTAVESNKRIENIYRIKTKALNLEKMRQRAQFEPRPFN